MMNLQNKKILFIGFGQIGLRKLAGLFDTGCQIKVISQELAPNISQKIQGLILERYEDKPNLQTLSREFTDNITFIEAEFSMESHENEIFSSDFIFLCTDNPMLHDSIFTSTRGKNIFVLRCDRGDLSDFINPIVMEKEELIIGISTSGSSPSYAKEIKKKIEELLNHLDTSFLKDMKKNRRNS